MKKNLRIFAIEELEKRGFVETPDCMYQYKGTIPDVGLINVSCKMSPLGKDKLTLFMCFDNPVKAREKGFKFNIHSGKYNCHFLTSQKEIKRTIQHLFEDNPEY